MDWLEILKAKRMVEYTAQSMGGGCMVRLAGFGLERIKMDEQEYQTRNNYGANYASDVFRAPLEQLHQLRNPGHRCAKIKA